MNPLLNPLLFQSQARFTHVLLNLLDPFTVQGRRNLLTATMALALLVMWMPLFAHAGSTDTEFQAVYTFVNAAATGFLGRSICIVGGLIGLGLGAASGKALPAIVGIVLAMFGSLGPSIVDSIFPAALV
jgi:hypothetical protein